MFVRVSKYLDVGFFDDIVENCIEIYFIRYLYLRSVKLGLGF